LRQSPVWRGGGAAFGPKPRDYDKKVNRKVARLALRRAFSEKVAAGQIKVVEAFAVEVAKTRAFVAVLKALGVSAPALVVVGDAGQNILLASRNLARVEVVRGRDVNVYQLLRYPSVLVDRGGMAQIMERMGSKTEGAA
jgi:large subunit ribosomal protein L4